jgi:hypothetical protein
VIKKRRVILLNHCKSIKYKKIFNEKQNLPVKKWYPAVFYCRPAPPDFVQDVAKRGLIFKRRRISNIRNFADIFGNQERYFALDWVNPITTC